MNWEFEQWLYEFKRHYGCHPSLTYPTLKHLLELWNEDVRPMDAVAKVRELVSE